MEIPSVQDRLKTVSMLIEQREELREPLELYRKILQVQSEMDNALKKGTTTACDDQATIGNLQRKSLEEKKPMIRFLEPSLFNPKVLNPTLKKITQVLIDQNIDKEGAKKFLKLLDEGKVNLSRLVEATLKEDIGPIREIAQEAGLPPARVLYMLSVLIQPCLEQIARKTDASLLDKWWQASCPVCGRTPVVAKLRLRKRYLMCTFCGAEYLSDSFLCVNCGNKDPYTLKYLSIKEQPAVQIDFCTRCKHYVKVVDETKLKEPLPKGLEDILTLNLDFVARKEGLERE